MPSVGEGFLCTRSKWGKTRKAPVSVPSVEKPSVKAIGSAGTVALPWYEIRCKALFPLTSGVWMQTRLSI
jgi:hypothetical protein